MTEDEKLEPARKTSADPKKVGIRGISCDVCEQLREKKIDGRENHGTISKYRRNG